MDCAGACRSSPTPQSVRPRKDGLRGRARRRRRRPTRTRLPPPTYPPPTYPPTAYPPTAYPPPAYPHLRIHRPPTCRPPTPCPRARLTPTIFAGRVSLAAWPAPSPAGPPQMVHRPRTGSDRRPRHFCSTYGLAPLIALSPDCQYEYSVDERNRCEARSDWLLIPVAGPLLAQSADRGLFQLGRAPVRGALESIAGGRAHSSGSASLDMKSLSC